MGDLGRRAVACAGWRWMPGMLVAGGCRVIDSYPLWLDRGELRYPDTDGRQVTSGWLRETKDNPESLPDFDNPATRGCLLELVREAWGRPGITTKLHRVLGWIVVDGREDFLKSVACDTEAEVLVAALEAAP